jgi:hypothetical protein
MAKTSSLPTASSPSGQERIALVQNGVSVQGAISDFTGSIVSTGKYVDILDSIGGILVRIDVATNDVRLFTAQATRFTGSTFATPGGALLTDTLLPGASSKDANGGVYDDTSPTGVRRFASVAFGEEVVRSSFAARRFRSRADRAPGSFAAQVNLVIWLGQSWSMGFDASPPVNMTSRYAQVLTFNGGVRQQKTVAQDGASLQSFVAGVETDAIGTTDFPSAVVGETGAIAFANRVMELIQAENNIAPGDQDYRLLVAAPGEGSRSIEQLGDPAGVYIARCKDLITQAFNICQANGWSFAMPAICWIQGQGETDEAGIPGDQAGEYPQEMEDIRALLDAHLTTLVPVHEPVKFLTWQEFPQSNGATAQASAKVVYQRFVEAADTFPHIVCWGASHQYLNAGSGNVHFVSTAATEVGADAAVAFKRTVIDGVKFQPLRPTAIRRQGKLVVVRTNLDRGRLVIDTDQVAAPSANPIAAGFSLYTGGTTPIAITGVSVSGSDVIIRTATAIPADVEVGYADVGTNQLRSNKWRGNVRDDGGAYPAGQNRWLTAFRKPLF